MTSPITTHVLDTASGRPAAGVRIDLARLEPGGFSELGSGETDGDGRLRTLLPPDGLIAGTYRIRFAVGAYYAARDERCFYPVVAIDFDVHDPSQHYHVPLLLSPFGYTTYRGS